MSVLTLVLFCMASGFGLVAFAMLGAALFKVRPRTTVILQRSGKSLQEAAPGMRVRISFFDSVVGPVNLRGQQLEFEMETRTADGMYARMVVAVQSVPGKTDKDVMCLVLMNRYPDMYEDVGANLRTNAFLFPHAPDNLATLGEPMRNVMIEAAQTVAVPRLMRGTMPKLIGRPLREPRSVSQDPGGQEPGTDKQVSTGTEEGRNEDERLQDCATR